MADQQISDRFRYEPIISFSGIWRISWILLLLMHFSFVVKASNAILINPNITVRLSNPQYSCVTNEYCLDVEFQSDIEDQELFGMNVRFFYEDQILELVNFRGFEGGYGPVEPNPPNVLTSPPSFGYNYFGFGTPGNGPADWVNGAIQLVNENLPPIYISTTGWTKLFQICFIVDDPNPDEQHFCPPILWDLEVNPANGGYLTGDDGVVITVTTEVEGVSAMAIETVEQFNWTYTGDGIIPPFGAPIETRCIILIPDATINASTDPGCYYTDRVFEPLFPEMPGATYLWNFGNGAIPPTATGYGPHTVYYETMGSKTVKLVIYPEQGGAQCGDSSTIVFQVNVCLGNILGLVKSVTNTPIGTVNVRLFADANINGIADNETPLRSVFTNANGQFAMASLVPGHYVLVEIQPGGWVSVDDYDLTDDGDAVPNSSPTDNLIPVSIYGGEADTLNVFVEAPLPGQINGNVFYDFDLDNTPDPGEGLANVIVDLYADFNTDGVADSGTPIATTLTGSAGTYQFTSVPVGSYVLIETNLSGYISVRDFDASNDADIVINTNETNDVLPITITNIENDANNYFIDVVECSLLVTNLNDSDVGSLRYQIDCAQDGDTIRFHTLLAGMTILITSGVIQIADDIVILSTLTPRITISSQINGLFDIMNNAQVEFRDLTIVSGLTQEAIGASFENFGGLELHHITIYKNPLLPPGFYLIHNYPNSELKLSGNCLIETD